MCLISKLKPRKINAEFDSLHLASAEYTKAEIFLTDKNLLCVAGCLKLDIPTANPLNWFMEVDDSD